MKVLNISRSGFSLIEVTIALGIAVFCLITVVGLLPLGLSSDQNASEQIAAAGLATAIISDLHGTPVASSADLTSTTSRFQICIPEAGGQFPSAAVVSSSTQTIFFSQDGAFSRSNSASVGINGAAPSRYRATLTFNPDSSAPNVFKVWILITWPALADADAGTFPTNFTGSFETVVALDCN